MRSLKRLFPQNALLWIGKSEIGDLLLDMGEVDRTFALEGPLFSDLFCGSDQWGESTHSILKTCSKIVCWLSDPTGVMAQNLRAYGIQSVIIQSPHDVSLTSRHFSDRYLETLLDWKVQPVELYDMREMVARDEKEPPQESNDQLLALNHQRIMIQPGSGSPHKCVDFSVLASVVSELVEKGHECTIVEGPADEKAVRRLCAVLPSNTYQVIRSMSLCSVARCVSSFDLFIGHDSGLAHLSVACGVPSIVLFGPTDPDLWAPQGRHVSVIQGEPCECPDWSSAQHCAHKRCLNISAARVTVQAERWLSVCKT